VTVPPALDVAPMSVAVSVTAVPDGTAMVAPLCPSPDNDVVIWGGVRVVPGRTQPAENVPVQVSLASTLLIALTGLFNVIRNCGNPFVAGMS